MPIFKQAIFYSTIAAFSFYLVEWSFYLSKASPISITSAWRQIEVLLLSPLIAIMIMLLGGLILFGIFTVSPLKKIRPYSILILPSLLITAAIFLAIENFSYIILGFYSGDFTDFRRYFYVLGLIFILFKVFSYLKKTLTHSGHNNPKLWKILAGSLSLLLILCAVKSTQTSKAEIEVSASVKSLPNIIIFATDGLRAENMSAYGSVNKTTPFIETLLSESLVFEIHFANNSKTTGSVLSMLAGKYPTTTRVIFRPDIFSGKHVYQHLPGLLRKIGYYNGDFRLQVCYPGLFCD